MKKTVLTFGLLSGAISSLMLLLTVLLIDGIGFDRAEVLGYTTFVAAFLLVFFGIRSYRDNLAGGSVTFGRAAAVGILITLVSCACYVAAWQVIYRTLAPDFVDRYAAHTVQRLKASGASQQEIEDSTRRMESFKALYANPLFNIALTFVEPFPIGLGMTLLSAAILRKRSGSSTAASSVA